MKLYLLLFFLFFLLPAFPQDNVRIFFLSRDIGIVLDSAERKQYNLMPKLEEFNYAFYFMHKDSFYMMTGFETKDGVTDSVVSFPYNLYKSLAGRVQLKEQQKKGNDDFNPLEPEIIFIDTVLSANLAGLGVSTMMMQKDSLKKDEPWMMNKLPLAEGNIDLRKTFRDEWMFYLGGGIGYNITGIEDLEKNFNLYVKAIGYQNSPPQSFSGYDPQVLFTFTSNIIFRDMYFTDIRISFDTDPEYNSYHFLLGVRYEVVKYLYPYIGAGAAYCHYALSAPYGYNQNGRYVERIDFSGQHAGGEIAAGVFYEIDDNAALNFYLGYKFLNSVRDENFPQGYDSSIDPSGFEIALTLMFR